MRKIRYVVAGLSAAAAIVPLAGCTQQTGGSAVESDTLKECENGPHTTVIDSLPSVESQTFSGHGTAVRVVNGVGEQVFVKVTGDDACLIIGGNVDRYSEIVITGDRSVLIVNGTVDPTSTVIAEGQDVIMMLAGTSAADLGPYSHVSREKGGILYTKEGKAPS